MYDFCIFDFARRLPTIVIKSKPLGGTACHNKRKDNQARSLENMYDIKTTNKEKLYQT